MNKEIRLGPLRHCLIFLLALMFLLAVAGCAEISYNTVKPDGTRTSAHASSLLSNTAIKGFNADSTTGKTTTGLKFSTSDTSPDSEALKTFFEGIGHAAGVAAKTAATP
jgi:hypothetical protein